MAGETRKPSGGPPARFFSPCEDSLQLFPGLQQANDENFTGPIPLKKGGGEWKDFNVFFIELNISVWRNILYSKLGYFWIFF